MIVEGDGSLLRSVSYMAETYLETRDSSLVQREKLDGESVLKSSLLDHVWPRTLS